MRHARVFGIAGFVAAIVTIVAIAAVAQTTVTPVSEAVPAPAVPLDAVSTAAQLAKAKAGEAQAGSAKAGACAACHGLDGNPTDLSLYPRLAGQSERYIARQLALFKSGERVNAIMQPFAMTLSTQDMRDIGAHFAAQKSSAGVADDTVISDARSPYKGLKFYQVGEQLYRGGDAARGLPACLACHGPDGAGNPGPAYPRLAGQPSWFTARRLQEFRAGTTTERDHVLFDTMKAVAKTLTDEEITALSSYLQGLHARSDEVSAEEAVAIPLDTAVAATKAGNEG